MSFIFVCFEYIKYLVFIGLNFIIIYGLECKILKDIFVLIGN